MICNMEKHSLEISWGSLWRIAIFLVFAVVIYLGHQIVLGLFLAIVFNSTMANGITA